MSSVDGMGVLGRREELAALLATKGLSPGAAGEKAALFGKATVALARLGGPSSSSPGDQVSGLFVPGRIEVLGKHTDYAGGRTMIAAAQRGFCVVVRPRDDNQVIVLDAILAEKISFVFDASLAPRLGHWSNYPMTVARRIAGNFPGACRGAEIALASDLPPAAGLSSSSALVVAAFLALAKVNHLAGRSEYRENIDGPEALAGYLGTIENGQSFAALASDRGVGTFGGSEDHTAILCAQPNHICQYAYCPVRFQRAIPLPGDYVFAVGSSGVVAEKTGAARERYNEASRLAAALAELWRRHSGREDPHLAAALASSPDAVERLRAIVLEATSDPGSATAWAAQRERVPRVARPAARPGPGGPAASGTPRLPSSPCDSVATAALLARLEHFLAEDGEILPVAGDALERGDLARFGELVDRSQRGAEQLLGNQVAETVYLAASARRHGAVAASAFGAGFGGSVWAMIGSDDAESFLAAWGDAYRRQFPHHAASSVFFTTAAGPAAFWVS